MKVIPPLQWWRLVRKKAVAYVRFPVSVFDRYGEQNRLILVRGTIVSIEKNRFGAMVAKIRMHGECHLYQEPLFPRDPTIEIDIRHIVGIDFQGTMVTL